nr:Chain B, Tat Subtype G Arginine Rich Motif [HIV-1 06TG.HT008]
GISYGRKKRRHRRRAHQ